METAESGNDEIFRALRRLDAVLHLAMRQFEEAGGEGRSPEFLRGLQISRADAVVLMSMEPGVPWFHVFDEALPAFALADDVPRLARLAEKFELTSFDLNALLVALAPEIDLRYERLYGYLQDDVTRKRPMVDLTLNLFAPTSEMKAELRARFSADSPLLRHGLLHVLPEAGQTEPPLLAHWLKADDQIVGYVLGGVGLDRRLAGCCRLVEPRRGAEPTFDADELPRLSALAVRARADRRPLRLYLQGTMAGAKLRAAESIAAAVNSRLLVVDILQAGESGSLRQIFELVFRAAWLYGDVLYLDGLDALRREERAGLHRKLIDLLSRSGDIVLLSGTMPWAAAEHGGTDTLTAPFPPRDAQCVLDCWNYHLENAGIKLEEHEVALLAGRFKLGADQTADAVHAAVDIARWQSADDVQASPLRVTLDDLCAAARAQCGHALTRMARKIRPIYTWDDIVLPDDKIAQLREICVQATHRDVVFGRWGFDRKLSLGKGLNILFSGPPGTGKTMAAEVIARELRLDIYKIDLSQIVSKYIGETEKSLDRVFTAAEDSNAILFFDEADALFGKRSEVKDSHDRYANIEIGYLLQKMEEYEGITILATNVKHHIDEAFLRRIQAVVEFPFPEESERQRVWKVIFPEEAPLASDVDFLALARSVRLASGNIRSIARASAFYAAADGGSIHMAHLLKASRREYQKLGRSWTENEWPDETEAISITPLRKMGR
ncbi:ATP-binding protein [Tunturiibacter lichenicola]|uniref:ATP-binding protein n=1 Tax=Tunturiibacter lichenicola TaxID=2051959 RepID=UPI003D9BCF3B